MKATRRGLALLLGLLSVLPVFGQTGAAMAETARFVEHTAAVYQLAWSPDGARIASVDGDGYLVVREPARGTSAKALAHKYGAWAVSWSPDGSRLVTGGLDRALRLWDPGAAGAGGGELKRVAERPVDSAGLYCVAWSPDGGTIAAGTAEGTLLLLDAEGSPLASWPAHLGGLSTQIIAVDWSPDGSFIASGGLDFKAKVWGRDGALIRELKADVRSRNDINGLCWSPDGSRILTADQGGSGRIWDVSTGAAGPVLAHGGGWVRGAAWSPDGRLVALAGQDRTISVWDARTGAPLDRLSGHRAAVWSLRWSADGSTLASGSGLYSASGGDTSLRLWSAPR